MIFFISRKRYSIGEILKHIFFRNPGIARLVTVERDVMRRGGGGAINREGHLYG